MNIADCYKVGYIIKPHGLKGEVTISLDTEAPVDWETLKTIFIEKKSHLIPYFIQHISVRNDKAFVKLEEVDTPEMATLLKGGSLYLDKKTRPKPAKGAFYSEEVIGFDVVDNTLGVLGTVHDVEAAGPNRFLIIGYNKKEVMIPVNGPFITSINKSKKKISVSLPKGFLDI
ncbi:MAG: ribosome maturation factor RimM [Cyclobacteriaceae bacterium]